MSAQQSILVVPLGARHRIRKEKIHGVLTHPTHMNIFQSVKGAIDGVQKMTFQCLQVGLPRSFCPGNFRRDDRMTSEWN